MISLKIIKDKPLIPTSFHTREIFLLFLLVFLLVVPVIAQPVSDQNSSSESGAAPTSYINVTSLPPPLASFTATPASGIAPLTVTFTDTSTNTPTSWLWNFGDGDMTNATRQNPVHVYQKFGIYSVNLTATSATGSNSITKYDAISASTKINSTGTIVYENLEGGFYSIHTDNQEKYAPFVLSNEYQVPGLRVAFEGIVDPAIVGFKGTPISITSITALSGVQANFTADRTAGNAPLVVTVTDSSTNNPTAWNWSWGDGSFSVTRNATHTYTVPGRFNLTLNVSGATGSDSVTKLITVFDPADWYDSLATNSSSYYGNQNNNFTWDTTDRVLISSATEGGESAMTFYKGSTFYGGTYSINWTPKSWDTAFHDDYFAEFLIGAQSIGTGEYFTSGIPMYAIYMKKSSQENYTALIVSRVNPNGTHDQIAEKRSFNPVLNHTYNVTAVWNPGQTTNTVNVSLDGQYAIMANDTTSYVNHAGYFGFSVHGGANTVTWYDHLRISNATTIPPSGTPDENFTTAQVDGTAPSGVVTPGISPDNPAVSDRSYDDGNFPAIGNVNLAPAIPGRSDAVGNIPVAAGSGKVSKLAVSVQEPLQGGVEKHYRDLGSKSKDRLQDRQPFIISSTDAQYTLYIIIMWKTS